jgi:parallel beta-helix repeat protein
VSISPGSDIQGAVNARPAGTAFCLRNGTFRITSSITPKAGNSFTGEYGAILDGTGWNTTDSSQGAFRAWNQNIDDVTIRNLVIRNMPRGVSTFSGPDQWVIDHNEVSECQIGIHHSNFARVTNNYIHDNRQYGLGGYRSTGALIEANEISYNNTVSNWPGDEGGTKWVGVTDLTIRGNSFHNNYHNGIWLDTVLSGNLIENNLILENVDAGIVDEVSDHTVIRNNRIVRNTGNGILLSHSQSADVFGNTLTQNGGIQIVLFRDEGISGIDLRDNYIHDNVVDASNAVSFSNRLAAAISCSRSTDGCTAVADFKNNRFVHNIYVLPVAPGRYFRLKDSHMTWGEWQAAGQD